MTDELIERTDANEPDGRPAVTRRRVLKSAGVGGLLVGVATTAGTTTAGGTSGRKPNDIEWCQCEEVLATGFKKKSVEKIEVITYDGTSLTFTEVELTDDVSPVEAPPLTDGELGFTFSSTDPIVAFRVFSNGVDRYYANLDPTGCANRGLQKLFDKVFFREGAVEGKVYYVCPEPPEDCLVCGDGDADKVSEITFRYTGPQGTVTVYNDNEAKSDAVVRTVEIDEAADREFTVTPPDGESEFKNDISVYVDGAKNAQFHTSCSRPFGPGIAKGDLEVLAGKDKNGSPLCPVECAGCGSGDDEADKVSRVTFEFQGEDGSHVQFYNDKEAKSEDLLFEGTLDNGEPFVVSAPAGESELENDVSLFVDGARNTIIHTSCSQPFGPGLTFGSFLVVDGRDKNGQDLCPIEPPEEKDCLVCGDGDADKVSEITFEYTGDIPATVTVYNDNEARSDAEAGTFDVEVDEDRNFLVTPPSGESEFKNDISVYVDDDLEDDVPGEKNAQFHTSCSRPFGPGIAKGDLEVVGGKDKNGRVLCDVECAECGTGDDDADGVSQLTISDTGSGSVTVYDDKEAKDDAMIGTFDSSPFTITPPDGEEKFHSDISFYVDGAQVAKLHTSCSQPLSVGMSFGDGDRFTIEGGRDKNGRALCE